jgi:hypothetical protein
MSALGQNRAYAVQKPMSALLPIADMCDAKTGVCFGQKRTSRLGARLPACQIALTKVEVSPFELRTTNSFCLKLSIILVVVLFRTVSFSAESMCKLTPLPMIIHVPRIVPVMPCPRVLLMKPRGRTWETNLPSALNEIPSFMSPTVPCQSPTIFALEMSALGQ